MSALRVHEVKKYFGGVKALDKVSLIIEEGELTGLIGPNGAGKTTFVNVVTGFLPPDGGSILLGEEDITGLEPHQIAKKGIGRTFQITRAFDQLSVFQNLLIPGLAASNTTREEIEREILEVMEFLTIGHLAGEYPVNLSGGQQKLLELGRVLMLNPNIVMLDEPFAGVHPELRKNLHARVQELYESGKTFMIISHDMESIFKLSKRVIVFNRGKKLVEGPPAKVREEEAVIEAYLGD